MERFWMIWLDWCLAVWQTLMGRVDPPKRRHFDDE